jgi:3-deoxy-D-manno-octulosonate 8-phosphate phosphatase KdsC-like HAD superfamily phosphatase
VPVLVVLDVDGTLVNADQRLWRCRLEARNRREFWECVFSRYLELDVPNWRVVNFAKRLNGLVAIVTGRREDMRDVTVRQLRELGIEPVALYMRGVGDFRRDYELKQGALMALVSEYRPDVIVVVDDSMEVLEKVQCPITCIKVSPEWV